MYLLDTSVLISMFKGQHGVQQRIAAEGLSACYVSELVLAELSVGAYKSGRQSEREHIRFVRHHFPVLPVDEPVLDRYAQLRASMEMSGFRIDSLDLLLAATALVHELTLITGNTRHFLRIPDLELENWMA